MYYSLTNSNYFQFNNGEGGSAYLMGKQISIPNNYSEIQLKMREHKGL
jgi:hypothetical protein